MTRILLISGSIRAASLHTAALRTAAQVAPEDITATMYEGLRGLPAYVPGEQHDAVTLLRHQVATADGLLLSTPEYGGSLPGSLKNLFDWLIEGPELWDKPVAWLSVAAAGQDQGALATLENVLAHGNARVLRSALIRLPLRPEAIGADGLIEDAQLHMAMRDMLQAFSRAVAPKPTGTPSWQVNSSLYPMVPQKQFSAPKTQRAPRHLREPS
ncbi:NADPH-dependent FMN reductase [Actinoplanes sp. NPDC051494]|uniref:NADPH-dependent FMN reductase n=1 Tax=Actinoplanes sp. NPDC051494 TaxID=3363907 RepID=UPI0037904D5B